MKSIFLVLLLSFGFVIADDEQYVNFGAKILEIKNKKYLALNFENDKKWHTYWKNPGDSGQEIKVLFEVDGQEIKLKDLPWPAPKRYIEQGDIWAYGYEGKYALFYEIDENLNNTNLLIKANWLVCKDICIPGGKKIELSINENLEGEKNAFLSDSQLREIYNNLPKETKKTQIQFFLQKGSEDKKLVLMYMIENADFSQVTDEHNIVTPYKTIPLTYKHEKIYKDIENKIIYGQIDIDWDGEYEEPAWDLPADGIFKQPITTRFLVQYPKDSKTIVPLTYSQFSLTGHKQFEKNLNLLSQKDNAKNAPVAQPTTSNDSILKFLFFAFLGGLILNLMPCVLPVISLKLFGLIIHSDESNKNILKHNLFYAFGVLSSFSVLATVVYILKTSGEQIGWGFQLQSPIFVLIMMLLIYIMALNMLGLFEFVTPGGKKLGNTQMKKGMMGDFINGVLATILSTPCSAPFLGSALPFAFTSTTLNIYLIFLSVGLGLAFPFILTGIFPKTIKFLPKPGLWMDKLKKLLGLSLLLTVVWLYFVMQGLVDMNAHGVHINSLLLFIFFAFYFKKHISKNIIANILFFLIPLFIFIGLTFQNNFEAAQPVQKSSSEQSSQWKPWTPKAMEDAKSSGGYTFINFTADWCLTCKVNKKLVLNTQGFSNLAKTKNIKLLEGDWTRRDDNITKFLRSYNIVGVPAYFLIKPNGEIISLGETITLGKIKDKL